MTSTGVGSPNVRHKQSLYQDPFILLAPDLARTYHEPVDLGFRQMQHGFEYASIAQYAVVGVFAFLASVVGGIAGYGTGLILPPILLSIVGPQAVVPIVGLSALMTNASRLIAFRPHFSPGRAILIVLFALPTCVAGAFTYAALSGTAATVSIGATLILLVPVRRRLQQMQWTLGKRGVALAGSGYGFLVGATSGSGVVLLSILMAAGLQGPAVVATDAGISLFLGIVKTVIFQTAGALPPSSWVMALLIGCCATPGAFLAKRLTARLSLHVHTNILDAVVMLGGIMLVLQALA